METVQNPEMKSLEVNPDTHRDYRLFIAKHGGTFRQWTERFLREGMERFEADKSQVA